MEKFVEILLEKTDPKPNFKSGDLLLINGEFVFIFDDSTWHIYREDGSWWVESPTDADRKEDVKLLTNETAKTFIESFIKDEGMYRPSCGPDGEESTFHSIKYYKKMFKKHGLNNDYIFSTVETMEET